VGERSRVSIRYDDRINSIKNRGNRERKIIEHRFEEGRKTRGEAEPGNRFGGSFRKTQLRNFDATFI
jgi:hypothetical protein